MREITALLRTFGFTARDAHKIAHQVATNGLTIKDVQAWIDEAQASTSLINPLGFVRARLRDGDKLPTRPPADRHHDQRHRHQGRTSRINNHLAEPNYILTQTCTCGQVVWQDTICKTCHLCPKCCTCDPLDPDKE